MAPFAKGRVQDDVALVERIRCDPVTPNERHENPSEGEEGDEDRLLVLVGGRIDIVVDIDSVGRNVEKADDHW